MSKENPNFTIITDGGCAAKCGFCTDSYNRKASPDYLANLIKVLYGDVLPSKFVQCSISGGEPTTSPHLKEILALVSESRRFEKVVLTTNGARLEKHAEFIARHINHLNVSRHAIGDEENEKVFKTKLFIKDEALARMCAYFNKQGVDVNLNYVYTKADTPTKAYVMKYIEYAQSLGANSISFRYDQNENSLEPTELEKKFSKYKIVNKGGCPVCRNHTIIVKGMPVVFKASFAEPSKAIKDVYELIYGIDGKLTTDWAGEIEFKPKPKRGEPRIKIVERIVYRSVGGGCGSSSSVGGGCGSRGGGCS